MTISLVSEYPARERREGWGVPLLGPLDQCPAEPGRSVWIDETEAAGMLRHALAGLPLGFYERTNLHHLAHSSPHTAGVVASLVWRARISIPSAGDSYWHGLSRVVLRQVAAATEAAGMLARTLDADPAGMDDAERLRQAREVLPMLTAACGMA